MNLRNAIKLKKQFKDYVLEIATPYSKAQNQPQVNNILFRDLNTCDKIFTRE